MSNSTVQKSTRFFEIDLFRGLAVIGMIVFHIFFILDFFQVMEREIYQGGWLILARSVQFTFLGLVGISLAISSQRMNKKFYQRQWRRALYIFCSAMTVSFVTFLIIAENYVRFGILHLIALSVFLLPPLANKKFLNLILGIAIISIGLLIKNITVKSPILYFIGFNLKNTPAIDYFPVFPWLGIVLIGIFLGHTLYKKNERTFPFKLTKQPTLISPIIFLGRKSLITYLIHVPIIIGFFLILNVISLETLLP